MNPEFPMRNTTLCSLEQDVCGFLVEVAGLEPAKQRGTAHRTLDYAVFDFHITNLEGSKQGIILFVHSMFPFFLLLTVTIR